MTESRSVFRKSLPLLLTTLVNKSGSIGITLLPILLVEGHYSTAQSSFVMSVVKGTTLVSTVLSGFLSDLVGFRVVLLGSFLLATVGLFMLPLSLGLVVLTLAGVISQLGITSVNTSTRLLLTRTMARTEQKEALGWMRFVNNLGQIFSYGLATLTASLGAKVLIWFDAFTSLFAFVLGWRVLPKKEKNSDLPIGPPDASGTKRAVNWWPFVGCTFLITGWYAMYEFFVVGIAGLLEVTHPDQGLRIFSMLMVLNTVLCAALAVVASRFLTQVVPSLALGVLLTAAGVILAAWQTHDIALLFVSALFLTLGEVIYGALGQFLLIRSVPASARENTVYSSAILVANVGRMVAAGLAFPLIIDAKSPAWAMGITASVGAFSLVVLLLGGRQLARLAD